MSIMTTTSTLRDATDRNGTARTTRGLRLRPRAERTAGGALGQVVRALAARLPWRRRDVVTVFVDNVRV